MVNVTRPRVFGALLVPAALGLSACTVVLGIEQARVDPTLVPVAEVDAGGSAGSVDGAFVDAAVSVAAPDARDGALTTAEDAPSDGGPSGICRTYCDDVTSWCTGTLKQYVDKAQCLAACALLPVGVLNGPDGNTAACRGKYALKAQYALGTEKNAWCAKAGPGSDGTCGSICDGYCSLVMPTCTEQKTDPYFFPDLEACLTSCRQLRDRPPYNVSDNLLPDRNDAQCRLFHVNSAIMDLEDHCEHALGQTLCTTEVDGGP